MMYIKFIPDLPINHFTADRLLFHKFAISLQKAIYQTDPPFAYGVIGDWGSGKTSILNLLQNLLNDDLNSGENLFVPIRFDAWKYENEVNLIYPLLHTIRVNYLRRVPGITQPFIERFTEIVLTSTLALTDIALRATTKMATGEALSIEDIADHFSRLRDKADLVENVLSGWANQVDDLQEAFETLLDCYAEDLVNYRRKSEDKAKIRFVFLVDDLDRCLPETVIKILESIKNYLLTDNCIFVLALNPRVVYQGIRVKYAGLRVDGREYLEKIINYSFYVPEPLPEQAQDFACEALKELVDHEDGNRLEVHFNQFGQAVRDCRFTNPRKVKRILNHFLFFLDVHQPDLDCYHIPYIIRFIVLAEYFPALFQVFLKSADDARNDFDQLQKDSFNIEHFEKKYGVEVKSIISQLRYMSGLFKLTPVTDPSKASLTEHAQTVFQIVHHPI